MSLTSRVLFLLLALAAPALAQGAPESGVQGSIVDETGRAVPGAYVYLWSEEGAGQWGVATEAGTFAFRGLRPGTYWTEAELPREARALRETERQRVVVSGDGLQQVQLRFAGGRTLKGQVVDAQGQPVQGFVTVRRPRDALPPGRRECPFLTCVQQPVGVATDAQGRFALPDLTREEYVLGVIAPGAHLVGAAPLQEGTCSTTQRVRPAEGAVRLVVERSGMIRGRAVSADLRPLAGVGLAGDPYFRTAPDGRFEVPRRRSGRDVVRLHLEGLAPAVRWIEAPAGEDVDLGEVVLVPGRSATITVTDDRGRALPGVMVRAVERSPQGRAEPHHSELQGGEVHSDETGRAVLTQLPLRAMELYLIVEGWVPRQLTLGAREATLRVRLERGARISGRVLDASGKPVVAEVDLRPVHPAFTREGVGSVESDSRGFALGARGAGEYVALVRSRGSSVRAFAPQHVRVPGTGQGAWVFRERTGGATLDVRLPSQRDLRATLVRGSRPVPRDLAALHRLQSEGEPWHPSAGPYGGYRFLALPAGTYSLVLVRESCEDGSGGVDVHVQELVVGGEGLQQVSVQTPHWRVVPREQ